MTATPRIPLSVPVLDGREREYLQRCIDDGWVAGRGPFVTELEAEFAAYHDRSLAVSTASGTAALHVALAALGLGEGDEVIVPALTFVASANVVRYVGATPVFADVDPHTYTLDPEAFVALIRPATRAVIVVHLYGHPADMDPILDVARRHDLHVVEDATEGLGACYRGRLCGTFGDAGCFSFNGNKLITAGGGGMLLSESESLLEHARHLTLQGRDPGPEYLHSEIGFNYALSNLQAAIGLAQLERLGDLLASKRRIAERYRAGLSDVAGLTPGPHAAWADPNFWLQSVLVDPEVLGRTREDVMSALDEAGIDSRPFFYPLCELPPYRESPRGEVPVSRALHSRGVSLPSSAALAPADQDRVIERLRP